MKIQYLSMALCVATIFANGCASSGNSFGLASQKTSQNSNVQFSVARAHEQEGNLGSALEIYESLYTSDPSDANVCHRIGVTKLRMGKIEEGISYLMEADALDPNNADIAGDIGYAHIQKGEFELAEEFLRDSLDIEPENGRNISNLAMALGYQGRMDECFTIYRTAVGDAEANANVAFIYSQRGNTEKAIKHYSEALDQDPSLKSAGEALVQMVSIDQKVQIARSEAKQSDVQLASETRFE